MKLFILITILLFLVSHSIFAKSGCTLSRSGVQIFTPFQNYEIHPMDSLLEVRKAYLTFPYGIEVHHTLTISNNSQFKSTLSIYQDSILIDSYQRHFIIQIGSIMDGGYTLECFE